MMTLKELKMLLIFKTYEAAPTLIACSIVGLAVILFVLGLADVACRDAATIAIK